MLWKETTIPLWRAVDRCALLLLLFLITVGSIWFEVWHKFLWYQIDRAHSVFEKSLKMLEFGIKTSRPLKVIENPWYVLEFKSCKFWNFAFVDNFEASIYCFNMDYKQIDDGNLSLAFIITALVSTVQYTSVSHCSLKSECLRLGCGFLSIILVLEKRNLGPWKSLKNAWILFFEFATNLERTMDGTDRSACVVSGTPLQSSVRLLLRPVAVGCGTERVSCVRWVYVVFTRHDVATRRTMALTSASVSSHAHSRHFC